MLTETTHAYRPRYVRRPLSSEPVLTSRDVAIFCDLADNRFLNTHHLQTLYGERVSRRLSVLFDAGYIDEPIAQRFWRIREGGGSRPAIWALADRGARALVSLGLLDARRFDWSKHNRELVGTTSDANDRPGISLSIPHQLDLGDAKVSFRSSLSHRSDLKLVHIKELAPHHDTHALSIPGRERKLRPDWLFGVARAAAEPAVFALEVDRRTEPYLRFTLDELEAVGRKIEAYNTFALADCHEEQFGSKSFRVLIGVRGGEAEMQTVAQTAYEICEGREVNRFLVTTLAMLRMHDPLAMPWMNAAGALVPLGL